MKTEVTVKAVESVPTIPNQYLGKDFDEEKCNKSPEEICEMKIHHRMANGNIAFPGSWYKARIAEMYEKSLTGGRKEDRHDNARRAVKVFEPFIDTGVKEFTVDRATVIVKDKTTGKVMTVTRCTRPFVYNAVCKFTLEIMDESRSLEEVKGFVEQAGKYGVGANSVNGFGQFELVDIKEIK